jgi:hypothetical protein
MKHHQFVICVENEGYEASLEIRKVYDLLEDKGAEAHGLVRVIDESGEDYLYPKDYFVPIELPSPLRSRTANPA